MRPSRTRGGRLVVKDDVSVNVRLSVLDASFQNDVDVEGKLVKDDVSFNGNLSVLDASFQNDVDVEGKLVVKDDVSVNVRVVCWMRPSRTTWMWRESLS